MMKNTLILFTAMVTLFFVSCSTKSKKGASTGGTGTESGETDLSGLFGSGSGQKPGSTVAVGSGSGGSVTEADKNAVKALADDSNKLAPKEGGYKIPQDIMDQAKKLMEMEKQGKDVSAQKIALAGQVINGCMNSQKYLVKEPFPGQPLMGGWSGTGQCPVNFTVGANPDPNVAAYPVFGSTEGQLLAQKDGRGDVKAQPFAGPVTDTQTANGKLRHPTFFPTKYGADPCDVAVKLDSSTNPIPENFKEGIKIQAQCQRQALFLISPVMDSMFQGMDDQSARILQQSVLGFK